MLVSRDVSINLTLFTGNPQDVLDNPDIAPPSFDVMILCPEIAGDRSRWAVLHRNANSEFKIGQVFAGGSVVRFLRDFAAASIDSPFEKSTMQVRPGLIAADILPTAVAA